MSRLYQCVVHEPGPVHLAPSYFKKPPNKVTEGNKGFWNKEVGVGGSICKKCWNKFAQRQNNLKQPVDIIPNDNMVCI